MPNWVYNKVDVSGSAEEIALFKSKVNQPRPESFDEDKKELVSDTDARVFTFWSFIAPPKEALESGEYFETNGWANGKQSGNTTNNWYNFNSREWGTKWDAVSATLAEESDTHLSYTFETAWSAPSPIFEAMVEQHPELEFYIHWEEEQGYGAEYTSSDGDEDGERSLIMTKEWDVARSHADYVERENVDSCRCADTDDVDEMYDDCPRENIITEAVEEPNLVY